MADVITENKNVPFITITATDNGYIVRPEYIWKEGRVTGTYVFNDFKDMVKWLWENMPQFGIEIY